MSPETVIATLSVITTAGVAGAGFLLERRWRKSDQRRQALHQSTEARGTVVAMLSDLTSGEVEEARHLVGTLRYGSSVGHEPTEQDVTRACYRLIWAIERTGAATLAIEGLDIAVVKDARTTQLQWHLAEIIRNAELLSAALAIDDDMAAARREEIVAQFESWGNGKSKKLQPNVDSDDFRNDLVKLKTRLSVLGIPVRWDNARP
ncbi:hypothetical protein FCK90_00015 [Kocuria coralli]|uniref:Uncharacterized protein n=1 Tax=Kocuria coralli TaxID=1461025 RepID=A0A5J5L0G6_9MICC|nr:hypothetical protein [Kocuria coralli]KAA9395459.1 hypothetical protein FCK90_00015 [Kocuria coralli]